MQKVLVQTFEYILDLFFPIRCLRCGKNREDLPARERWICPDCLADIQPRSEQVCPRCKEPSSGGVTHSRCHDDNFLDGLWSAAYYDDFFKKAVHEFKFKFIKDLSSPLSAIMARSILEAQEYGVFQDIILTNFAKDEEEGIYLDDRKNEKTDTILIPVPLHRKRYNERGFNQSLLLAKFVGEKFVLSVREDILLRIKNTKPQSKTASGEERWENIKSAFLCVKAEEIRGKHIVLIDDVCTTSATLNECAKELKRAGAKSVWGLILARR